MPQSVLEIKEQLERVIGENGAVKDMAVAANAITMLERISVTTEELERTRVGLYVNTVRKAANGNPLAKRAKNLIKIWQQMIKQGGSQTAQRRFRPQTPNSVGSSPSPPDYTAVSNHAPIRTPPVFPNASKAPRNTQVMESPAKKLKKHSKSNKTNKIKLKSPVTVTTDEGGKTPKGQSSEVKGSQVKTSPDTGQHMVSVMNPSTNGLRLTFKMQPVANDNEDEEVDVLVTDSNQKWRHDMLEEKQTETTKPPSPPRKDGRKKHKKKKSHKKDSPVSPPSLPPSERKTLPTQEDTYNNNNKKEPKMVTSQSMPNFTVTKQSKHKSPDKTPNLKNNILSKHESIADMKTLSPQNANPTLKRKRELPPVVNNVASISPPSANVEKPRGPKERRLTLTYDPQTGQIQQKASNEKLQESSPTSTKTKSVLPEKKKVEISKKVPEKEIKKLFQTKEKSTKDEKIVKIKEELPQKLKVENSNEITPCEDDFPTSLLPVIDINAEVPESSKCSSHCTSNSYETRREFRKRKTRRKEGIFDLQSMFPISNLVTFSPPSDSDESLDPEEGFCSTVVLDKKPESKAGESSSHSSNCEWSGVTGCRGNNGTWYDWLETFCIKNNKDNESERLPNEEALLPLHILPYVELD